MLILALDTSAAGGSAAIVRKGAVVVARDGDGSRTHGERLPLELMAILDEAHAQLHEIDAFAVITGPGSFTGLRVGIATIQGLALAQRKRVAPVSTFEALAFELQPDALDAPRSPSSADGESAGAIAVWIDAHRGEVFASLYGADARTVVEPPSSLPPEATLDAWARTLEASPRIRFTGDGALRYADVIRARFGDRAVIPERAPSLAASAGVIAARDPARAVAPHALVPLYVRRPDAELARDRRQAARR